MYIYILHNYMIVSDSVDAAEIRQHQFGMHKNPVNHGDF